MEREEEEEVNVIVSVESELSAVGVLAARFTLPLVEVGPVKKREREREVLA